MHLIGTKRFFYPIQLTSPQKNAKHKVKTNGYIKIIFIFLMDDKSNQPFEILCALWAFLIQLAFFDYHFYALSQKFNSNPVLPC